MSLDKGIRYGKEHREEYRGAKRVDSTCRNHGTCPWCKEGRQFKGRKNTYIYKNDKKEYEKVLTKKNRV